MTNREVQVVESAEVEAEHQAVADVLNDAFNNDPEELRAALRLKFGEHLDAKHPRIGPTRGEPHEYTPHAIYSKQLGTSAVFCVHCGCRKDWLVLVGSKVCSAHTTHAKSEQWARRGGNRPSPMEDYYGGPDRP